MKKNEEAIEKKEVELLEEEQKEPKDLEKQKADESRTCDSNEKVENVKREEDETNDLMNSTNGGSTHETYDLNDLDDDDFENDDESEMPLLKYSRIEGSLPRMMFQQATNSNFQGEEGGGGGKEEEECNAIKSMNNNTTTNHGGTNTTNPLASKCKCSTMGRVTISPYNQRVESSHSGGGSSGGALSSVAGGLGLSTSSHGGGGISSSVAADASSSNPFQSSSGSQEQQKDDTIYTTKSQTFYILAMAMDDGKIHLIDHKTGLYVCQPNQLKVNLGGGGSSSSSNNDNEVVALSFDASGTYLAAVTAHGDVAIFEFKFGIRSSSTITTGKGIGTVDQATAVTERPELKRFNSFLSRIAGEDWTATTTANSSTSSSTFNTGKQEENTTTQESTTHNNKTNNTSLSSTLPILQITHPISTARFSHKSTTTSNNSNSSKTTQATCISIDPSYKRKREKCVIVGFSNGRLVYTKRSGHGGTVTDSGGFGGVMGNLLQPKRHDVDLYQSVTPAGSNTVYHGIECIAWRGSLVSWADASGIKLFDIEKMARIAHIDRPTGARASLYPGISSLRPSMIFESSDSLLIAWGDCLMNMKFSTASTGSELIQSSKNNKRTVKCAMAWQLDCVACGVVPIDSEHVIVLGLVPCSEGDGDGNDKNDDNSDKLVELQVIARSNGTVVQSDVLPLSRSDESFQNQDSTANYCLHSSFATPRMEDSYEFEQEEAINEEVVDFDIQSMLNAEITSFKSSVKKFVSPHLKWNISTYKSIISCEDYQDDLSSMDSENSDIYNDDYSFLFQNYKSQHFSSSNMLWSSPTMTITSLKDAVLVQTRDVDDSIAHARSLGKQGVALKRGLCHRQIIRRHNLNDLIDECLRALLFDSYEDESKHLNLRRLKIAARATATLFGGDITTWIKWIEEFAKIPGALFLLQQYIPTRDPKLPKSTYEFVLLGMLEELETLYSPESSGKELNPLLLQHGLDIYLETLRAWGPISSLRDRLKLHRLTINETADETIEQSRLFSEAQKAFSTRMNQSAENYLKFNFKSSQHQEEDLLNSANLPKGITLDSLFHLDSMQSKLEQKLKDNPQSKISSTIYQAVAEIYFMKGMCKESLYNYLSLANHIEDPISAVEEEVTNLLSNNDPSLDFETKPSNERFLHILTMIEDNDLHRTLLKKRSNGRNDSLANLPPLVSLISLVGLEAATNFIIYHCTLPKSPKSSSPNVIIDNRSDLPINQIAAQLNGYPKILFWFLQRIFSEKPEVYVQFPNTAVPPSAVTDLHRTHFFLHIDYADRTFDDSKKLTDIPTFDELNIESPMMRFLKVTLPHGGIRSDDVRSALEKCRSGENDNSSSSDEEKIKFPHLFAHELAYVIERSGSASEEDAIETLMLYLEGVVSLPLAVEFVMRHTSCSSMLWEALVAYCLNAKIAEDPIVDGDYGEGNGEDENNESNGQLFGSLLAVAARSGADLAHLVSQIPTGMSIHGIRSKLVTAISDYRFKLKINEDATRILQNDKVSLLREQCHRSRRGVRIDLDKEIERKKINLKV